MKGQYPPVAKSIEITHCEHGHVDIALKDANGRDIAYAHLDLNGAIGAVASIQRALIAIEQQPYDPPAGHA